MSAFQSSRTGKDQFKYDQQQIKTAEFRSAKKLEEEALMAALGMKIMPPSGLFHV
jgi:hypothetical protein